MFVFLFFPCYLLQRGLSLCHPFERMLDTLRDSLIEGLPVNDVASPAVRRDCQLARRIEVNKPKCMYMLRDRLLSEQ